MQRYSIVGKYCGLNPKARFNVLYKEYTTFPQRMKRYESTIVLMISSEKACARRDAIGDLGVRVQTNRISSIVEEQAIEELSIEEYLSGKTDGEEVLMHVESAEEIKAAVRELKIMHLEYDAFRKNLHELSDTSKEILIPYIEKRKEVDDIADELGVSADTVKTRIKRIKKEISFYMEGAMNVYDENIMIIGGIA